MTKAGEKLQTARLEKGLTLEDVAKGTKIKIDFLKYIEEGKYNKLPSVSYAYGFVRNYAGFLGISEKEIMPLFKREFDEEKDYLVLPKGFEKTEEFSIAKFKVKRTIAVLVVFFILFLGYISFQYRYAFIDPPLEIISPAKNFTISSSQVTIIGKTDPNSTVYVGMGLVSVDQNGVFKKTVSVFPGETIVQVRVINKFSRETDKQIKIEIKAGS
jgi:cytoskeletal protein RodZ